MFRGNDNHVRTLYWMFCAVGNDNLTGSINAPRTSGDPAGWFSTHDGFHHVVYRTSDGRLHELWHFLGEAAVHHEDLTAAYGAPPAAERPVYYSTGTAPHQHVAYRGTNGHIYEVLW